MLQRLTGKRTKKKKELNNIHMYDDKKLDDRTFHLANHLKDETHNFSVDTNFKILD